MLILHNRISKAELKKRFLFSQQPRITISFYKYFNIVNIQKYRDNIYKKFFKYHVLGRVYIANEGINAQISIPVKFYDIVNKIIQSSNSSLKNIRINKALNDIGQSFWVLSIKIKKNIVADGIKNTTFDPYDTGIYLQAPEVNAMIKNSNTILVDMRNYYEYKIGHFEGAINIKSNTFREQLQLIIKSLDYAKHKNIIMYCTGGIRCEKATAWMKFHGFKNIYHIEGGIIGYVSHAKKNNLPIFFKGKMFVFDYRMSEKISHDVISKCQQCHRKEDTYTNCAHHKCHRLFIQCHRCSIRFSNCCSIQCMNKIII
ncbi:rhodanese-related sulfurtransferase [Buchnera aphidicola]|uniref:oxygen-dependent tRNA uridine(34) hydroxylase TrhO n=1 Tax=Buchnera aphidicola TaxID=9 RepID=UPI003463D129